MILAFVLDCFLIKSYFILYIAYQVQSSFFINTIIISLIFIFMISSFFISHFVFKKIFFRKSPVIVSSHYNSRSDSATLSSYDNIAGKPPPSPKPFVNFSFWFWIFFRWWRKHLFRRRAIGLSLIQIVQVKQFKELFYLFFLDNAMWDQ